MARYQIRKVFFRDDDEFMAEYKDHTIEVWHHPDEECSPNSSFDIVVTDNRADQFAKAYEGCWGNPENTMDEAIEEALIGSHLITNEQRRFNLSERKH